MMVEQATVVGYQNGIATVQCYAKQGCGGCGGASHCGTKALSALAGEKTAPCFELKVEQHLAVGDQIEIGLTERSLLFTVFCLYGIPLGCLIGSALLFSVWFENELLVLFAMLLSLAGVFYGLGKYMHKQSMQAFTPVFLRKL